MKMLRQFLLMVCVFAIMGGTVGIAAAVTAAPCAHEHSDHAGNLPAHHDQHGAGCLACCLGACTPLPDVPPRPSLRGAVFSAKSVSYWETAESISDRVIQPDLGPPRTTA